jgi:uncharacterized membrane protein YgdD (TMEM256/DUF423 family)
VADSPPIFTLRLSLELAEMPNDPSAPPFTRLGAAAVVFAALAGAAAVALGAWAAHGAAEPAKGWLTTASTYQLIHALALLATALLRERLGGPVRHLAAAALAAFALGIVLFCGALVALSFGQGWGPWSWRGTAPAGGLALIAGWAALALTGLAAGFSRRP